MKMSRGQAASRREWIRSVGHSWETVTDRRMTLLHLVAGTGGADKEADKELKAWHEPTSRPLFLVP